MTIGSDLREAREQRGVSLREIAERTNIRLPVLRAIENDDFRLVPGSVIMRGFLKLYAREVGLDPDDIGRRYTEQLESSQADRPREDHPATDREPAGQGEARDWTTGFNRISVGVAAGVLVLMAAGYLLSSRQAPTPEPTAADRANSAPPRTEPQPAPSVNTSKPSPPPEPGPAAVGTAAASAPDPPRASREAASDAVRVDLQATGDVWVAATADGQQVAYRVLTSGERLPIRAAREAILRIGIPANVTISINDQPIRPFERPGTPTTLTITPANYRDLLAR